MNISFRDPEGRVFRLDGRILRFVEPDASARLFDFLESPVAGRFMADRKIVPSYRPDDVDSLLSQVKYLDHGLSGRFRDVIEHPEIEFPSYPYEWPAEMLYAAARLTLDLAQASSPSGYCLKDASPYNILFEHSKPIFVDVLSFERRDPLDPTWLPYAEFARTFLLPLLAYRYFKAKLSRVFVARREGLEPEDLYRVSSRIRRLTPPFLNLVTIPKWLGGTGSAKVYRRRAAKSPAQAKFILDALFRRLGKQLEAVRPPNDEESNWTAYADSLACEEPDYVTSKRLFVEEYCSAYGPRRALDIGCNTGIYSKILARSGAEVVAVDTDQEVVGRLWTEAQNDGDKILPLVVDIARPSPGTGWMNRENRSFLDRARGQFDTVVMLAVVHHLMVTERVPLSEIISLAAMLTRDHLIIEFVAADDPMFVSLLRGRDSLYEGYRRSVFESTVQEKFYVARIEPTPRPTRWLYHLRKKHETSDL
ncbi:MAG: class I SAM-dependent methyltransferase [Pyrinomonadaceae bacterium]|nr:class I SAM-dependent methyltransferase [Pyrinomonadaceae bacterium]